LSSHDGKWPDELSLIPWKIVKPLVWDTTVVCIVADLFFSTAAREFGSAAADKKG